jgi:hypothetical protein
MDFSANGGHEKDLAAIAADFHAANPKITVQIETTPYADYFTKLQTAVAGGTAGARVETRPGCVTHMRRLHDCVMRVQRFDMLELAAIIAVYIRSLRVHEHYSDRPDLFQRAHVGRHTNPSAPHGLRRHRNGERRRFVQAISRYERGPAVRFHVPGERFELMVQQAHALFEVFALRVRRPCQPDAQIIQAVVKLHPPRALLRGVTRGPIEIYTQNARASERMFQRDQL